MKSPLYFHIREENRRPVTFCIQLKAGSTLCVGHSVVFKKDQFCKRRGREISSGRMGMAFSKYSVGPVTGNERQHEDIKSSIPTVINKAKELFKLEGTVPVRFVMKDSRNQNVIVEKLM
jgi:hypothetical protein